MPKTPKNPVGPGVNVKKRSATFAKTPRARGGFFKTVSSSPRIGKCKLSHPQKCPSLWNCPRRLEFTLLTQRRTPTMELWSISVFYDASRRPACRTSPFSHLKSAKRLKTVQTPPTARYTACDRRMRAPQRGVQFCSFAKNAKRRKLAGDSLAIL